METTTYCSGRPRSCPRHQANNIQGSGLCSDEDPSNNEALVSRRYTEGDRKDRWAWHHHDSSCSITIGSQLCRHLPQLRQRTATTRAVAPCLARCTEKARILLDKTGRLKVGLGKSGARYARQQRTATPSATYKELRAHKLLVRSTRRRCALLSCIPSTTFAQLHLQPCFVQQA